MRNGGPPLPPKANPAEHMLEVIGAAPGAHTNIDWPAVWRQSPEYKEVKRELESLKSDEQTTATPTQDSDPSEKREFAAPLWIQAREVTKRLFQ